MPEEELINEEEQVVVEEKSEQKPTRPENRFKDLSDKVETTAKERDEAKAKAEEATKEVEFYKGFSKLKYPEAVDYQDKIKEKVMAGYEMEDAAMAVLGKAGKLVLNPVPSAPRESPAGGSATTNLKSSSEKTIDEMSQVERRSALEQAERESGYLTKILRGGF